jgi:hypothetical protein
MLQQ